MDWLNLPWEDVLFSHVLSCLSLPDLFRLRAINRGWQYCIDVYFTKNPSIDLTHLTNQMTGPAFTRATFCSSGLQTLILRNSRGWLTDTVLVPCLDVATKLKHLDLSRCSAVSDVSMKKMAMSCQRLEHLRLRECNWLSKEALQFVSMKCVDLQTLDLSGCWQLDDEAIITSVQLCPRLKFLSLEKIFGLTNVCAQHVAKSCPSLVHFNLQGCWRVTDDGIRSVGEYCKSLASLKVSGCRNVTEASLARLRYRGVQIDLPAIPWTLSISNENYLQHLKLQV